jgi:hypothetical protein
LWHIVNVGLPKIAEDFHDASLNEKMYGPDERPPIGILCDVVAAHFAKRH